MLTRHPNQTLHIAKHAVLAAFTLAACGGQTSNTRLSPAPESRPPVFVDGFVRVTPQAVGLDPKRVERLVRRARGERSDALVILKRGKLVVYENFGAAKAEQPIIAMSVTKSVVAMAYGALLTHGQLKSLDVQLGTLFPELQGAKARITLRQLLTHTSGLDSERANLKLKGIEEHALASPLSFAPGTHVEYNNNTSDFLAAIFPRVSGGLFIDDYLQREIFGPLGIQGAHWLKDKFGVARGAGELVIRAIDLAKLGQLMLNRGMWQGRRILDASWVQQAIKPGQPWFEGWGQLWWRYADFDYALSEASLKVWALLGIDAKHIDAVRPLVGRRFNKRADLMRAVRESVGAAEFSAVKKKMMTARTRAPFDKQQRGPLRAFYGEGWLGQYLVIVPKENLVAVRMRAYSDGAAKTPLAFSYREFVKDVVSLASIAAPD